ncbi:helix-turn-helix domain-containing protein [Aureimonas frigidaquae]|uniref:DNA-binding protein n=1 Tax=Aureimonas frigidaquae TaxID=424757 RepID=A0A0P0Z0N1_9HYPH|nr:hypothetical protein [Aureimonas frigidaquae]BAT27459.1 DNA-binding protein [Aureimonas frigidaquae]
MPSAAVILVRNGMPMRAAHLALTKLADTGDIVVELPNVEDMGALATELKSIGIKAHRHSVKAMDAKAVRQRTRLSQKDFALRFGLDEATIRNWEQNRSGLPAAARVLLTTIDRFPDVVASAIEAGQPQNGRRTRSHKEAKDTAHK